MALVIAEHCSMLACDHIGEACKAAFSDSTAATHFKMHRTKCTEMINGVLAPYFLKRLVADVSDQRFSLLLDESTDISVSKYLGVLLYGTLVTQSRQLCQHFWDLLSWRKEMPNL